LKPKIGNDAARTVESTQENKFHGYSDEESNQINNFTPNPLLIAHQSSIALLEGMSR
jgi:hypothetical protein